MAPLGRVEERKLAYRVGYAEIGAENGHRSVAVRRRCLWGGAADQDAAWEAFLAGGGG